MCAPMAVQAPRHRALALIHQAETQPAVEQGSVRCPPRQPSGNVVGRGVRQNLVTVHRTHMVMLSAGWVTAGR